MTMSQIEQLQNELSQATCDLINAVAFASEWQGQAMQLRDRIERALQVLRDAQAYDWVEADVLSEVRKILESTP
jgi:hypothetical protein